MQANNTEIEIINSLLLCRFQPGPFDEKLPKQIDVKNISPLQRWWIYKLGYKYRKQIKNDILMIICKNYIENNNMPFSRKESTKYLKII
jgi:hypothetical protein